MEPFGLAVHKVPYQRQRHPPTLEQSLVRGSSIVGIASEHTGSLAYMI